MAHFDTTADVAKFIADFGFSINSTSASDFSSNHTAYHCTLTYDDKSIPVTYNGTSAPTVMDVVHAVVQDAYSYDTTHRSIDTFASEYGYNTVDTPISKVLNAFNKCKESYEWLCDNYGKPLYSYDLPQLVKMIDDHQNEITDKVNFIVKEKETLEAYSNPPVPEGFVSLKEVMDGFDLGECGQRITEHDGSEYLADTFSSIADDNVDIYYNKLFHWLPDNYEWLEDAADEGLLEGVKDGDIIKMTQIAQYVCYEKDLYDHQDDIVSYFVANDLYDKGVYIVSEDIADTLSVCGENFERLDLATDYLQEEIKNSLIAHFEEMYGEENEFIYEMADKVIDSNFTMVNPCVMHVATANIVNEKGYEQAFEDQWKDYLIEHRCSDINASDLIHYYNFLDRLQSDCKYYLGACVENQVDMVTAQKHLWAGTIEGQIDKMREIYENLPENEKPAWLSLSDIDQYEKKMLAARDKNNPLNSLSSQAKDASSASKEVNSHNTPDMNRRDEQEK
ncbi:LPD11 domain-containing protein [Streptococcus equi]|uniref:LPD11 domain-containing protein n=1 Tax=Streptococcus equi TaxID=1336 RepID=UPI001E4CB05E|nr:LPD11 domain-containing protein [Streptococcus equi]MCD3460548.1 hypothetical protein [Streptococcus equi subsp. zooepidemicus]